MRNTPIKCSPVHGCSPDGLELRYLALSGSVIGPLRVGGTAPDPGCDHDLGDAAVSTETPISVPMAQLARNGF